MNSNVNSTIINMSAIELAKLTTEVKETVATNKTFSTTDLWNIQRNRRTQNLSKRAVLSRRNTIL